MGFLASTGTFVIALVAAASAEEPRKVQLPHDWNVGTRYHVEHVGVREEFALEPGARASAASTTTTPIDVEVVARRAEGYTLRWTYGRPRSDAPASMPAEYADGMLGLVEGLRVEFETDASGSITRLANRAAVEAHFTERSRALLADLRSRPAADEARLAHLATTLTSLRGDTLEAAYTNPARSFYLASGAALVPGERASWEDLLPNPFGGQPLPSVASIVLRDVDAAARTARVEWRRTIDPTKAGPILERSLRERARRAGQELPGEASLTFDAIEDAATWTYDLATGVPRDYVSTRTTTMAGVRRIETQRVTVSDFRTGPAPAAAPTPESPR